MSPHPRGRWLERTQHSANDRQTEKPPYPGAFPSGRADSNCRPLVPQTSALTRLRHAPRGATIPVATHEGALLKSRARDAERQRKMALRAALLVAAFALPPHSAQAATSLRRPTSPRSRSLCERRRLRRADRRAEGAATTDALIAFQSRVGLEPDGVLGPRTRRALGKRGKPELGSRRLASGVVGWDVAELQFLLAWHGFPSGPFDGIVGSRLEAAVLRFQRFHHLPQIGDAGPLTIGAARSSAIPTSPIRAPGSCRRSDRRRFRPARRRVPRRARLHRRCRHARRRRGLGSRDVGRAAR